MQPLLAIQRISDPEAMVFIVAARPLSMDITTCATTSHYVAMANLLESDDEDIGQGRNTSSISELGRSMSRVSELEKGDADVRRSRRVEGRQQ